MSGNEPPRCPCCQDRHPVDRLEILGTPVQTCPNIKRVWGFDVMWLDPQLWISEQWKGEWAIGAQG